MKVLTAFGVGLFALAISLGIAHAASAPAPVVVTPQAITYVTLPTNMDTADGASRKAGENPPAHKTKLTSERCPEWEDEIAAAGLPPIFSRIAKRESGCVPDIVSKTRYTGWPDVGLLQIQGSWRTVTSDICRVPRDQVIQALRQVPCNLAVARYLYDHGGLGHWGF
jgi:hypothetical protein